MQLASAPPYALKVLKAKAFLVWRQTQIQDNPPSPLLLKGG